MLFRSQAKVPALQQERDQLLEGLVQKDAVLELAEKRSSSLAAQLAALEKSTLAQVQFCLHAGSVVRNEPVLVKRTIICWKGLVSVNEIDRK